jgi:DNA repair protein RadD
VKITLRHYQAEVTPAMARYFRTNKGKHGLVALPTGAGKTFAIADLVKYCLEKWDTKIIILSHVKEILEQNHKSLELYLDRKVADVTVAGIQSVFRNPEMFKEHNLVIIDEAHLISDIENSMYQKFFAGIGKHVRVGFTATPFRLGSGYIYGKGAIFDDLVVDWTTKERYNQLIEEGYLAKLTTKRTELEMDTSGIKKIGGDFSEKGLAERFDVEKVTNKAIREILAAGVNRAKWLIFAIDIKHAEHITKTLIDNGISAAVVHSKMDEQGLCRDETIQGLKDGNIRCIVNVNILTTGFDDPGIDFIAMLRPTSSPVLHVQAFGRGSRVCEGKVDCLILDFAGNTARLGPINDVTVKKAKKLAEGEGEPITKNCPDCQSILPAAVRKCPDCGHKFKFQHRLEAQASTRDVISDGKNHWVKVDHVFYEINRKFGAPDSVKVTYYCGGVTIDEWVCVEHKGFAKHKADHWVRFRGGSPCTTAVDLILQVDKISKPEKILVQKKGRYNMVKDAKFKKLGEEND